MRLFVYEYTCARTCHEVSLEALVPEGRTMFSAICADMASIPNVELLTLSSPPPRSEEQAFRNLARHADFTLVIAPEFDDLLYTRCRWVEDEGGRLLGPSSAAVKLTSDKLSLSTFLRDSHQPVPRTIPLCVEGLSHEIAFPVVLKPRWGAGSQETYLLKEPSEIAAALARQQAPRREAILQPFVPGIPASVAFLIGPNEIVSLAPAMQLLSDDGRFRYQGGRLPLPPDLGNRATRPARRAVEIIPGLFGYVGVDVILGEAADGSKDWLIEVNPRLTTSYIGLRAHTKTNLSEAMLQIVLGFPAPRISWDSGAIQFNTRGAVTRSELDAATHLES